MGRRMVEHGAAPMLRIDGEMDFVADLNSPTLDPAAMGDELRRGMLRVVNFNQIAASGLDQTAVADLAAGFAVEGSFGREQLDLFALHRFRFAARAGENTNHRRFAVQSVIADEINLTVELNTRFHTDRFARLAATAALLFHQFFETGMIDGEIFAAQDVLGQIERKTVGIVQSKGDVAR